MREERSDHEHERFLRWRGDRDAVVLWGPHGERVLLLRNKVGGTWYRQLSTPRQTRWKQQYHVIGAHDPALPLKTGHLDSEIRMYHALGYRCGK